MGLYCWAGGICVGWLFEILRLLTGRRTQTLKDLANHQEEGNYPTGHSEPIKYCTIIAPVLRLRAVYETGWSSLLITCVGTLLLLSLPMGYVKGKGSEQFKLINLAKMEVDRVLAPENKDLSSCIHYSKKRIYEGIILNPPSRALVSQISFPTSSFPMKFHPS